MKNLNLGEERQFNYSGVSLKGFVFNLRVVGADTPLTATELRPNLSKIDIRVIARQAGKNITVYSGTLLNLAIETNLNKPNFEKAKANEDTKVITSDESYMFSVPVYPGIFNLQDDENMEVTIKVDNDTFNSNTDVSSSAITFDILETNRIQEVIPKINQYIIPAETGNWEKSLENNLLRLVIINDVKDESDNIFSNLRFSSKKHNISKSYDTILAENYRERSDQTVDNRKVALKLLSGEYKDNNIEMEFDPTQINTAETYVISRSFISSETMLKRAKRKREEKRVQARLSMS